MVLAQMASREFAVVTLKKHVSAHASLIGATEEARRQRRETISVGEENAIRYVAGYVIMKMKKKYSASNNLLIQKCLLSMDEGVSNDTEEYDTF